MSYSFTGGRSRREKVQEKSMSMSRSSFALRVLEGRAGRRPGREQRAVYAHSHHAGPPRTARLQGWTPSSHCCRRPPLQGCVQPGEPLPTAPWLPLLQGARALGGGGVEAASCQHGSLADWTLGLSPLCPAQPGGLRHLPQTAPGSAPQTWAESLSFTFLSFCVHSSLDSDPAGPGSSPSSPPSLG